MFLDHGRCVFFGSANAATDVYLEAMSPGGRERKLTPEARGADTSDELLRGEARRVRDQLPPALSAIFDEASFLGTLGQVAGRIGTGSVRLAAVAILDDAGNRKERFAVGDTAHFHILARAAETIAKGTVSVQLVNRLGVVAWATNHTRLTHETLKITAETWIHAVFHTRLDLGPDHYILDVSVGDASGEGHVFDRITAVASLILEIKGHMEFEGIARLHATCEVQTYE
jgi:hypothetical protein